MIVGEVSRWSRLLSVAALTVLAAACSSPEAVTLENLGLAIEADIQAGASFEVVVPMRADTTVRVVSAPDGVTAAVVDSLDGETRVLTLAVASDTPRGAYSLGLGVVRDGEELLIGFPFDIIEPIGAPSPTLPGSVEALLTVESPQPSDLFETGAVIRGQSSLPTVLLRLSAGGQLLAEGAAPVSGGVFETAVDFENACCIEMLLEVYHPGVDGFTVAIPLAYPESS